MSWPPAPRAAEHLVAEPVDGLAARPLDVVLALAPLAGSRALAALSGGWSGTRLLVCADPVETVVRDLAEVPDFDDVATALDAMTTGPTGSTDRSTAPPGAVGGGWLTLLGHALGRRTGRVRTALPPRVGARLPDLVLARYDHVLRFDGARWWAEALDPGDGSALDRARALAQEARAGLAAVPARLGPGDVSLRHLPDAAAHMRAVEQVVTAVRGGDIAQANVCSRFGLHLAGGLPGAARAWVALVEALDPDRAVLATGGWGALVGASPELYLGLDVGPDLGPDPGPDPEGGARRVRSAPIKGTRPAGDDRSLRASVKDASENVMIVDLVRNDLSRVSVPGSVTVDDLLAVQPHTGVSHLVSRVSGTVPAGTGPGEVVRATFPPGSVTGTPKQRATEVTDEVETAARGAHTGAVGWLGPGLADLAVTIRSLEVAADGEAALGVGGGIVADSTPAEEWHEVLTKAAPLLRALGVDPPAPAPTTASAKGVADPRQGLIETVLAVDGRAVEVADHAARLRRSFWELTGQALDADLEGLLTAAAHRAGAGAHRVRVRVPLPVGAAPVGASPVGASPAGGAGTGRLPAGGTATGLRVEVEPWHRPVPVTEQPGLVLGVVPAPEHGLERHKYADRAWVDRALAGAPGVDDVALADPTGALLETTRSCLLAVLPAGLTGGEDVPVLLTPPADGRILPGVTRQVCTDLARAGGWAVRLAALDDEVLARADGLVACNALRGVQWVREVGAHRWPAPSADVEGLSRALLARWHLA